MRKTNNQKGIVHQLLLIILALLIGGLIFWRVRASNETHDTGGDRPEADLQLQNIGIASFDDTDYTMHAVREWSVDGKKGLYVFGDMLPGNRQNPNFEFASMKASTKVIASIDGIVAFIKEQPETKDFEVFLQPKENSQWTVGYDHMINVAVKKGDTIKAGDFIGNPAVQNNGLYRFEMQINKDVDGTTTHVCPVTLLAPSVKASVTDMIAATLQKWETFTGIDLYNAEKQDPIGCIKKTLTPAEAEGR